MFKKHKFISFLIIFVLLFSVNTTTFANTTMEQNSSVNYTSEINCMILMRILLHTTMN